MSIQNKLSSFKILKLYKQPYPAYVSIYILWVVQKWTQAHHLFFTFVVLWQHFTRAVSPMKTLIQVYPKVNALLISSFHPPQHFSCPSRPPAGAGKPGKGMWSIANLWGWRQRQRRESDEHSLAHMLPLAPDYSPSWDHSIDKVSSVLFLVISHLSTEQMFQGMRLEHY